MFANPLAAALNAPNVSLCARQQAASRLRRGWSVCLRQGGCVLALTLAGQAQAGLGEPVASVVRDQVALNGQPVTVSPQGTYSYHEFSTAEGTRVREYVTSNGTVFATTWTGPIMPDLKVLLATYHADYSTAAEAPQANRRVLSLNTDRLVLRMNALPRGFTGAAYLPAQVPVGLSPQDIR